MLHVPGPDFPTGGLIYSRSGIDQAYQTGRGSIDARKKAEIEREHKGDMTDRRHRDPLSGQQAKLHAKIAE
ncbi:MAG: hypothetical protein R3F14_27420 [Polyangiaceae bacterium]